MRTVLFSWLAIATLTAAEHRGQVRFGGLPIPGASVTATQGDKVVAAITDPQGSYSLNGLDDGPFTIQLDMFCFVPIKQEISNAEPKIWEMKLLPLAEMKAAAPPPTAPVAVSQTTAAPSKKKGKLPPPIAQNTPGAFQKADLNAQGAPPASDAKPPSDQDAAELSQRAADGFLVNGSRNNGASSPFSQIPAFGNFRKGPRSLYNGNLGLILGNAAFDARTYSLTGQDTPKPSYNRVTGLFSFGGPLKIHHLLKNGPNITVNYQWMRQRNGVNQSVLMPTAAERLGDFSKNRTAIFDPTSGVPFAGGIIPQTRISPQAKVLLELYPLPNFNNSSRFNFQVPVIGATHQDSIESRANKSVGKKDQLSGNLSYQSTRSDNGSVFGFLNTTDSAGINSSMSWRHGYTSRLFVNLGVQFSRFSLNYAPYFANRENISGKAGINGNNQDPLNWGPPQLNFSNGIASLNDGLPNVTHNQTNGISADSFWNHSRHNFTFGADFKKQQFNLIAQQDPRGTFTFTDGSSTKSAFAAFLLGIPDTTSIAFGNADKYFRSSAANAFITDDWRIGPGFTLNAGVRWEYGSPITERYGRLVNLDIAPGFTAQSPVIAANPVGSLTGLHYPDSLVYPVKHAFQPRIGMSWRPLPASSLVIRGGYGVYYNTSVYQSIARQMAQQSPLSKSLNVANNAANPLTLANGFRTSATTTANTFAIDPNFLVGYAQNWQLSIQKDLPQSLIMTATYLGIKGTRAVQQSLPNTYPVGAVDPCPTCPRGFAYLSSNGNSTRQAGTLQLRRRLHSGFTATANYTYSKSIDDSALGGRGQGSSIIAQNWLNLRGERGLSNFDQRHLLTFQMQYSSGMGKAGGMLMRGWRGRALKEWTFVAQVNAGSGLPLSPIYFSPVNGTGVTGTIRPDVTGAALYTVPQGLYLNSSAFAIPAPGRWGNAGRNSITGPSQFTTTASLGRGFKLTDRYNMDFRLDASNPINNVTFPSWVTNINSAQFGSPAMVNAMRTIQTTLRVRF